MNQHVRPPPDALPRITPHLVVKDASAALGVYEKALGAKELYRTVGHDGRILFSEMLLHDSRFFVVDEFPEQGALSPRTLGGTAVTLHLYVDDVDAAFARATAAGMTAVMPPANFFWGERYAQVKDPSGHQWAFARRVEDLTPDARYVADLLKTIHGPIVLVGHSYGGAVITNAAAGLAGVKALVYVDAAAPAPGEANGKLSGSRSVLTTGKPAALYKTVPRPSYAPGANELYLRKDVFIKEFASDLPRAEAVRLWASQRGASSAAFTTPSRAAAWACLSSRTCNLLRRSGCRQSGVPRVSGSARRHHRTAGHGKA